MTDRPHLEVSQVRYQGTVKPAENFDPERDANTLRKAMKGYGTEELHVIAVLGARSSDQRRQIAKSFKEQFSKDLVEELKSELSGKFEVAVVALMQPAETYDACSLHSAMKGIGTRESVLIEILCSRTSKEIQAIKEAYHTEFGKELIDDIKCETSGDFQALLVALLETQRLQISNIDEDAAYGDANKLYEAGEKKWGTDEDVFINILTSRSCEQLRAIFQAYQHIAKCDIISSLHSELSGDFRDAMDALVRNIRDPALFFAVALHSSLVGTLADSTAVTRIIISRSEVDLVEIKAAYLNKYGKSLNDAVVQRMRGTHEALLLKILGE